jgi:hypothetical protein
MGTGGGIRGGWEAGRRGGREAAGRKRGSGVRRGTVLLNTPVALAALSRSRIAA